MSHSGFAAGRDDIIRLNRKEQQSRKRLQLPGGGTRRPPLKKKGGMAQGWGANPRYGAPRNNAAVQKGVSKLRLKRALLLLPAPHMARRRAQVGVVTGLASRRPTSLQRGFYPANRTAYAQRTGQRAGQVAGQRTGPRVGQRLGQRMGQMGQRTQPFVQRPEAQYQRPDPQRRPRQATFLSHRGLKVHTQVQKQSPYTAPVRTRQPPTAWSLHPQPAAPPAPLKLEPVEKKTPKGVPLQFDINSVAKPQTAMTLNERFRILKDQRATTQGNKGSRFVTVS
ncbi:hypothetical protein CRUP_032826 [Coryphaenoides rupestris]|nr:hypothetical protein CRUP_032826 [Coryphaenoides rupestris]